MKTQIITKGDHVRSYDIHKRYTNDYIEGIVTDVGPLHGPMDCDRYHLRIIKKVDGGKDVTSNWLLHNHQTGGTGYAHPPVNGTPTTMGNVTDCVEKVEG